MTSLAQLQRELQSHIVDGDESFAPRIESSASISAATRLRIYFDAYRLRLIEALEANYPVLAKLLGADEFARMTQLYLSQFPSRHFSIRWFGHELSAFLNECNEYADRPWLKELAEWEWNVAAAFDATNDDALTAEDLSRIAPDDWPSMSFSLCANARTLRLTTNVVAIVKAANDDTPIPKGETLESAATWLIWRRDLLVKFRSLDNVEAAAFAALANGATFGELCERLADYIDEPEVPATAATYLRAWIEDQLLSTARHPSQDRT